jgi:hypothetical protein
MSKLKAIKSVLLSSNYIVLTDSEEQGCVSPIYAEKFQEKLQANIDGLKLVEVRHQRLLAKIADRELGEDKSQGEQGSN